MTDLKQILNVDDIYFLEDNIGGISCVVGYVKKFKWSWMATQLNTFIIIGDTEQTIDRNLIEEFSKNCFEYALKNNKGWMRGLQAAVGSVAILRGKYVNQDAINFCEKLSKKHWSAFEIPVLYDLSKKQAIRYKKPPMWGAIYFPYFTKTIDQVTSNL